MYIYIYIYIYIYVYIYICIYIYEELNIFAKEPCISSDRKHS